MAFPVQSDGAEKHPPLNPGDLVNVPSQFEVVTMPDNFDIRRFITTRIERPSSTFRSGRQETVEVVEGFEDVLLEPLGAGYFYNHASSVYQLAFALSVATHPAVAEVVRDAKSKDLSPHDAVRDLRESQVLAGMRIIDLGSGVYPGFAIAAKALGATAYTADVIDLTPEIKASLDGHVVVNLNRSDAPAMLEEATGGDFDIVTENIIAPVPGQAYNPIMPKVEPIQRIGNTLLNSGGHLFCLSVAGNRTLLLRKG